MWLQFLHTSLLYAKHYREIIPMQLEILQTGILLGIWDEDLGYGSDAT
jgi:hypothetical protein